MSNFRSDVTEELTEEPSQEQEEGKKEDQQNKSKRKRKFDKYVSIPQLVSLFINYNDFLKSYIYRKSLMVFLCCGSILRLME